MPHEDTYNVVVLAADRLSGASVVAADADGGDGRALDANDGIDALDDDTEQAQERARDGVSCLRDTVVSTTKHRIEAFESIHLRDAVAALDGSSGAGGGVRVRRGGGGGKDCEGGDGEELGEHGELWVRARGRG